MGGRDSSARGVFLSDDSDFAGGANAQAAGGMDAAWRASALERIAARGLKVVVGEGLYRTWRSRAGYPPDVGKRGGGDSRQVSARHDRNDSERRRAAADD